MPNKPLTEAEAGLILSGLISPRNRCLFILGTRTGFRISELLSLTIPDCVVSGLIKDSLTVRRKNMKGSWSSRTIITHPEVRKAIQDLINTLDLSKLNPADKLFPIQRAQAHRIISNAALRAGILNKISCNSMRKTFAMNVYKASGKDISITQKAMGHRSLASTSYYLNADQAEVDRAILGIMTNTDTPNNNDTAR